MEHLAQEGDDTLVASAAQVEARVIENPVVIPVAVGNAMLVNVFGRIVEAIVGRGHRMQIRPDPGKEGHLFQAPGPVDVLSDQEVKDVATGDGRDRLPLETTPHCLFRVAATIAREDRAVCGASVFYPAHNGLDAPALDQPAVGKADLYLQWENDLNFID